MRKRSRRAKPVKQLLFITAALILLGVVAVSFMGRRELTLPQKFILEVLGTAQAGVTGVINYFGNTWSNYIALIDVQEENDRLKEELHKSQAINVKYREARATNIRLSKLLDLKETLHSPNLSANIIGRDPSQWFKTFIIDRSNSDGVTKGMPVITVGGVVGHVLDGSGNHAKVLQANDPNSAIEVLIQDTRTQGIIKGTGIGYRLHYVLKNNEVKVGDQLVTSGLGGVFPKGLLVGTVSTVVSNRRGMFLDIEVQPAVNFSKLEHVIIIMKSNPLAE
jgi:rod shape-determining protein MreC